MRPSRPFPLLPSFSQEDVRLAHLLLRAQALRRHARWLWHALLWSVVISVVPTCAVVCANKNRFACDYGPDRARSLAFEIGKSIELYKLQNGAYPTMAEGLQVLASPPKGKPLMERVPKDPWGHPYAFLIPGLRNPEKFDVLSYGPDGWPYTDDDIGNWPDEG